VKAKRILISRTDNIGDVILTLPMATVLKRKFPESEVLFLGKPYTKPIIEDCQYVDDYINWEDVKQDIKRIRNINADLIIHVFNNREVAETAKKAKVKLRLATSHRLYNLWTCNRFVHFSRRKSDLHEAQLNLKMLAPLGIKENFSLEQIADLYGWRKSDIDKSKFQSYLSESNFNIIFHIKSFGNAKEWHSGNFLQLAKQLPLEKFHILITGTEKEGKEIRNEIPEIFSLKNCTDVTGKFEMSDFYQFVQCVDGLVACSTGPLHIAASKGIRTLGLYPSARPKHAGRWGPIGSNTDFIEDTNPMDAPLNISVESVLDRVIKWSK
jgi:ADP-heptose:LPS heptosyltransferase